MNTVKELHIDFDIKLQELDSNRKGVIEPQEKDWLLNYAVYQFINSRINPKSNQKGDGFEDTQKRYDDLSDLKRSATLPVYIDTDDRMYSILPVDYYTLIDDGTESTLLWNCNGITGNVVTDNISIANVEFKADSTAGRADDYFREFRITLDSTVIFQLSNYPIEDIQSQDGKFIVVKLVLEVVNRRSDVQVYWENYDTEYYPNQFIFVKTGSTAINATVFSSGVDSDIVNFYDKVKTTYSNTGSTLVFPNRLVSSKRINSLKKHPYGKSKYTSPLCTIEDKRIKIYHDDTFIIDSIAIEYIKKPIFISLALNQMVELASRSNEIVDIAVQKVEAWTNDVSYKNTTMENLLVE